MSVSRKLLIYCLFFCSILLIGTKVGGQSINDNVTFNNCQKKDGLPSNNILGLAKDKLVFLWIATNDGLCPYD